MDRERFLLHTFVSLADTLHDGYDALGLMQHLAASCAEVLAVSVVVISLEDGDGRLQHVAIATHERDGLDVHDLVVDEGPWVDAHHQLRLVVCRSYDDAVEQWPGFAHITGALPINTVAAVPMRLRSRAIGALTLFSGRPGALGDDDLALAQALADMATIGVVQERLMRDQLALTSHLEVALESRVIIEQAKGIVAAHNRIDVDDAFRLIRRFSRDRCRRLSETAQEIVAGSTLPHQLARSAQVGEPHPDPV